MLYAAASIGFALGGFFDGILLHQLLQWHHLLSALDGPFASLRAQVVADGAFHALMYVVAAAGIAMLVRSRAALATTSARRVAGAALVGFGAWHVLDGVVSHWLLGIHRIRMDVPDPLFWDLLWFFAFGVATLAIGAWLMRSAGPPVHAHGARSGAAALVLAVLLAAPAASLPPPGSAPLLVLFAAGVPPDRVHDAVVAAGAAIVSFDVAGNLWVLDLPRSASTHALRDAGAIIVTRSPVALGCLAWSRA